jgi:hypothetical protein
LVAGEKRAGDLLPLLDALAAAGTAFHLRVVGDGGLRDLLVTGVAQRDIQGRVEFCGRLSQDDLYERVYPDCDVILLFSESEAFAIALVEAMMHGVVPVSSRFIGQRAEGFVREGGTGLTFAVGDMAEAATCIARLDHDAVLMQALSDAARTWVLGRYTWEACCRGWLDAFDEVLDLPARAFEPLAVRPATGDGRLDRLGLPGGFIDAVRRMRVQASCVPSGMISGGEWPFADSSHSPADLAVIEALARQLDQSVDEHADLGESTT